MLGAVVCMTFLLGRMACNTDFVSVGVAKIGAIVVGVVFRPQAGRAFTGAAVVQGGLVRKLNYCSASGKKRNHLTIARLMRRTIKRGADNKKWPWASIGLPASPWAIAFAKAGFNLKHGHERFVKSKTTIKIAYPNANVRKHGNSALVGA